MCHVARQHFLHVVEARYQRKFLNDENRLHLPEQREQPLRILNGMRLKAIQKCHHILLGRCQFLLDGFSRLVCQVSKLSVDAPENGPEFLNTVVGDISLTWDPLFLLQSWPAQSGLG